MVAFQKRGRGTVERKSTLYERGRIGGGGKVSAGPRKGDISSELRESPTAPEGEGEGPCQRKKSLADRCTVQGRTGETETGGICRSSGLPITPEREIRAGRKALTAGLLRREGMKEKLLTERLSPPSLKVRVPPDPSGGRGRKCCITSDRERGSGGKGGGEKGPYELGCGSSTGGDAGKNSSPTPKELLKEKKMGRSVGSKKKSLRREGGKGR